MRQLHLFYQLFNKTVTCLCWTHAVFYIFRQTFLWPWYRGSVSKCFLRQMQDVTESVTKYHYLKIQFSCSEAFSLLLSSFLITLISAVVHIMLRWSSNSYLISPSRAAAIVTVTDFPFGVKCDTSTERRVCIARTISSSFRSPKDSFSHHIFLLTTQTEIINCGHRDGIFPAKVYQRVTTSAQTKLFSFLQFFHTQILLSILFLRPAPPIISPVPTFQFIKFHTVTYL